MGAQTRCDSAACVVGSRSDEEGGSEMSVEELIAYLTGQQPVPGSHPTGQTLTDLMAGWAQ